MDESSPQTRANTQRLWSFDKPVIYKNTDYIKANAFAFYSINGNNLIEFKDSSKSDDVCEFLEEISRINHGRPIVLIMDNARAHHALKTTMKAKQLGIILVFLPPYSPDLNPVEFIWKSIKREISVRFVQSKQHMRSIIKTVFMKIGNSLSFAKAWMKKFDVQIRSIIH
ncbi:Integrase catalytic region (plasmid) [Methanohalobium evestigatum Z-7303]|uniref:Integrase catalytic region n=2 Tax=Methanohalobium evestigatum TaxID=2322 RepID=D7E8K4_METEZ|nr:Integrase catalytic region [Methanohalobium evestigatum Z-7303]ADI75158.1 Integrase catalytic region [Methanohalobium evestigatum Z-7303]